MATTNLHEPAERLRPEAIEMHRAIASLIEELEAVDWYAQRVEASEDDALRAVLAHNRDEEKEHACMTLEWIRRRDPGLDRHLRRFLFTTEPIADAEGDDAAPASPRPPDGRGAAEPDLGIGSLREEQPS